MDSLSTEEGLIYLLDKPYIERSLAIESLGLFPEEKNFDKKPKRKEGYYNIGWSNQLHKIISRKTIDSSQVEEFKEIAKQELRLDADWMLCGHSPAYAIELFSNDMLYYKTSFCFECDTWINEVAGEYVRLRLLEKQLFSWLNNIIPLPLGYGEA